MAVQQWPLNPRQPRFAARAYTLRRKKKDSTRFSTLSRRNGAQSGMSVYVGKVDENTHGHRWQAGELTHDGLCNRKSLLIWVTCVGANGQALVQILVAGWSQPNKMCRNVR